METDAGGKKAPGASPRPVHRFGIVLDVSRPPAQALRRLMVLFQGESEWVPYPIDAKQDRAFHSFAMCVFAFGLEASAYLRHRGESDRTFSITSEGRFFVDEHHETLGWVAQHLFEKEIKTYQSKALEESKGILELFWPRAADREHKQRRVELMSEDALVFRVWDSHVFGSQSELAEAWAKQRIKDSSLPPDVTDLEGLLILRTQILDEHSGKRALEAGLAQPSARQRENDAGGARYACRSTADTTPASARRHQSAHLVAIREYLCSVRNRWSCLRLHGMTRDAFDMTLYIPRQFTLIGEGSAGGASQAVAPDASKHNDLQNNTRRTQAKLIAQLKQASSSLRICILGPAGAGKSTCLEQITRTLADSCLEEPDSDHRPVPFLLSTKDWEPDSHHTLEDFVHARTPRLSLEVIQDLCRAGRVVLLFDGIDEVSEAGGRQRRLHEWLEQQACEASVESCAFVLAGRSEGFDWTLLPHFRRNRLQLHQFNTDDVGAYITHYFHNDHDRASRLLRHLDELPGVRRLTFMPLLLNLLCFLCETVDSGLPVSEGDLLETTMRSLLRRRELPEADSLGVLSWLAWSSWLADPGEMSEGIAIKCIGDTLERDTGVARSCAERSQEVLRGLAQHSGIITRDGYTYTFVEETFREYFAGRWLAHQSSELVLHTFERYAWNPRWLRVLVFAMDHLGRSERPLARRIIRWLVAEADAQHDDIWHTLTFCAARLCAPREHWEGPSDIMLLEEVTRRAIEGWRQVELAQYRNENRVIAREALAGLPLSAAHLLLPALADTLKDDRLGPAAVDVLRSLGTYQAETVLFEALLKSRLEKVREGALQALVTFGSKAAGTAVEIGLKDGAATVRLAALRLLSTSDPSRAVEEAVASREGGALTPNEDIIKMLGDVGGELAERTLAAILEDNSDEWRQRAAAEALGRIGSPSAIDELVSFVRRCRYSYAWETTLQTLIEASPRRGAECIAMALAHEDAEIRAAAVKRCTADAARWATLPLIRALQDPEWEVRCFAAEILAEIGSPEAATPLIEALAKETDVDVRETMVHALGATHSEDAIGPLVSLVGDPEANVSRLAGLALMPILGSDEAIRRLAQAMVEGPALVRTNVPRVFAWLGAEGTASVLIKKYHVPEGVAAELRLAVALEGVDALIRVCELADPQMRREAAAALAQISTDRALVRVRVTLAELDAASRAYVLDKLDPQESEAALAILTTALTDRSVKVRRAAASQLRLTTSTLAVEPLIEALANADDRVRTFAIEALGKIRSPDAVEPLVRLLEEDLQRGTPTKWSNRRNLALALGRMGCSQASAVLERLLKDADPRIRATAAESLAEIDATGAANTLIGALSHPDNATEGAQESAYVRRISFAATRGAYARRVAAKVLGAIQSPLAVEPLLNALKDERADMRVVAAEALGRIGAAEAVPALIDAFMDEARGDGGSLAANRPWEAAAHALAAIGTDDALKALVAAVVEPDGWRSHFASHALCKSPSSAAVKLLLDRLHTAPAAVGSILEEYCQDLGSTILPGGELVDRSTRALHPDLCPP